MAVSAVSAVSAHAPNPIEFIHIPKTGGQAIEAWGLHHGLAWGGCRLKAGGPSWPAHPGKFGSYTRGCSSFHIPPVAWEAARTPPFTAGAPTFCVVRNPFTRAVSEYTWQAKWTPYWSVPLRPSHQHSSLAQTRMDPNFDPHVHPGPSPSPNPNHRPKLS